MRSKGFTAIEVMIVLAIIGILLAIVLGPKEQVRNAQARPVKPKATVTVQCVGGYQVFVSESGQVMQIRDSFDNIATCVE